MKLIDTVPYFLNNYEPSISFLKKYYSQYSTSFEEYFAYHCKDTEERHLQSIRKYPSSLPVITEVHRNIKPVIKKVTEKYKVVYDIEFPNNVNLIVGGFSSNAFTHRQVIPDVTFSLEKLSPNPEHLHVIVAHEFGHAAHNILTDTTDINWNQMRWENALLSLYREGAATYFSKRIVPNLNSSIYFSYNDEGEEWMEFCKKDEKKIIAAFLDDYSKLSSEDMYKEWFSINGGTHFGFNRLAYYIGYIFFETQVNEWGEMNAILAWKNSDFIETIHSWLQSNG
ncbi:hypothetical protein [Oceanobacillus kimchii]|uniref:hypothetical protein n=1 Tax=Oceanobacillus kimchii TaxID=746691 RepID=UPI00232CD738|nr:hypothetical protein [Oceanobacillus kimchii]